MHDALEHTISSGSDRWVSEPNMPTARYGAGCGTVAYPAGKNRGRRYVVVAGGKLKNAWGAVLDTVDAFDLERRQWARNGGWGWKSILLKPDVSKSRGAYL